MRLDNEIARYEGSEIRKSANLKMAKQYEIVVVGGGMAGMTLACALAGSGISTAVVDRLDPSSMKTEAFDGRTTSIAHGSAQVLKVIGLWPLVEDAAEPILDIRVADGHPARGVSPLFLHYDHTEVGNDPFGYIIENRKICDALYKHAASLGTRSRRDRAGNR